MRITRRASRRAMGAVAAGLLATTMVACGDDDDDATEATDAAAETTEGAAATTAPADTSAPGTTAAGMEPVAVEIPGGSAPMEFCEGFIGVEMAMSEVPEDPAAMESFVADEIAPNRELVDANVPDEIAEPVASMFAALDEFVSTGDFAALESPEFAEATAEVYPYLVEGCGLAPLDVEATDYAFSGVPQQLDAGLYVLQLENNSEAEFHEVTFAKIVDDAELTVPEILALPEEEAEQYVETFGGGTFAPPGETGRAVLSLTEGTWAYVCFIPVGASPENEEGTGPPHFMEGMQGSVDVS
jgi:hypothetical protein